MLCFWTGGVVFVKGLLRVVFEKKKVFTKKTNETQAKLDLLTVCFFFGQPSFPQIAII